MNASLFEINDLARAHRSEVTEQPRSHSGRWRTVWVWTGDIILTLAVLLGLFVFWQMSYSNVQSHRAQAETAHDLRDSWVVRDENEAVPPVAEAFDETAAGEGVGFLRIPKLGVNQAIIHGVSQPDLARGPGWYPDSQVPGVPGNTALAGHRDGQGAPFHTLDQLNTCDTIAIETRDRWMVYKVLPVSATGGSEKYVDAARGCVTDEVAVRLADKNYSGLEGRSIVAPDHVEVVDPVPGAETPAEDAQLSLLTLTTCHPIWSNQQRLIIHAVLVSNEVKTAHPAGWQPEGV